MILTNAIPRLTDALEKTISTNQKQTVKFIYNELLSYDGIISVFDWIFRKGYDFTTNHTEYRFEITIHPKK